MHPDRNYGNVEETTKLFAEVQSAYEVLSDAQERAWYDSNRTRILRGEDSSRDGMSFEDNVQDVSTEDIISTIFLLQDQFKYNDTQASFYATVRKAFETIAHDEEIASLQDGVEYVEYPDFGQKDETDQDFLRQFYIRWGNFSSRKSFSRKEAFRYSEAPDRRVRRMMEKENKRLRDMAVREYNEAVRSLTSFVKKRDVRYKPIIQNDSDRQKALRDAAKAQAMRSRAANKEKLEPSVTGWAAPVRSEENAEEAYGNEDSEESRVQYECVVCKKSFKSEQQYEAHEKSKKHLKGVQHLRRTLQKESEALDLDGSADEGGVSSGTQSLASPKVGKHQNGIHDHSGDVTDAEQLVSPISEAFPRLNIAKNLSKEQDSGGQDVSHIEAFPTVIQLVSREEDDETRHVDRSRGSIYAAEDNGSKQDSISSTGDSTPPFPGGNDSAQVGLKLGKAKRKRAKKAAQAVAAGSSNEVSSFIMLHIRAELICSLVSVLHLRDILRLKNAFIQSHQRSWSCSARSRK